MNSEPEPTPRDQLRASDADRQAVVERLQAAFAEGRLDLAELDERTAGAYAAKTLGDLKPFTVDLPPPTPKSTVPAPPPESDDVVDRFKRGVGALPNWVLPVAGVVVALNLIGWIAAAVAGGAHWVFPWWIILIIIWVVGGRAHNSQKHEDHRREMRRRQEQRRNDWYDRYHRRSRGYYDGRYRDD